MFKSFISKFIFFFWFFFLIVTIPIYYFTSFQFKNIIRASEDEKVTITFNSLRPIISIHIFLDQDKQLNELLNNTFENKDIKSVKLISEKNELLYSQESYGYNEENNKVYTADILDLISHEKVATLYLKYANHYITQYNEEIFIVLVFTFFFSLIIFSTVFFYIRYDLIALRNIADSLRQYSLNKEIKTIVQASRSKEISTIANVANEMFINLAEYVKQLKLFNNELEKRVKDEINKQQNQERMMIHQSRQAAMGEMLESIAHQWRQPLNIIGIATANLETEYDLGLINEKKFHEKMDVISLNLNYMSDTIDDFRDFLNPKKDMNTFEAKKSIEDVLSILSAQLKNYNIEYSLQCNDELLLYGVENEFKQVMLILLNNSKDAIKLQQKIEQTKKGNIVISINHENDHGVIKLCDNGGGVASEIIDSIFEPYFSTKLNANGTGIGLYIAKNIIESRMNGSIGVINKDSGCCFIISVPLSTGN
ncbi:MAG: HAMP domain-containing histidine kinase [Thiovulaceae bacterium]|nr:HAMP domain-containing histidine kinase [Sulfurimonadaceae bacterium]